jgi:alkaline phosphatase
MNKEKGYLHLSKWLIVLAILWNVGDGSAADTGGRKGQTRDQKNVIVLMTDGTGSTHTTITRWYKGGPLRLDEMFVSAVRTYGTDSIITDSAPAATAFATGHKSNDKYVGIYPSSVTLPVLPPLKDNWKYKPLATVLEAAKITGKSVGLIATSNIQHASPAGYSAHVHDRSLYNEIAEQQVYLDIDVVFGGGKQYLLPVSKGGKRSDNEDLIEILKNRGYRVIETRQELLNLPPDIRKVWGLFADDDMAYEFDRRHLRPNEPSLSEMTKKAIEILSRNPKGFFLFVEGSKVDWASHANDPIGVIGDVLAFDEAVGAALDFAKARPRTLVLAFADHGNGGMSLGSKKTDNTYSKLPLSALVDPLKKAKLTGEGVEKVLGEDRSESNITKVMADSYGITDLSNEEVQAIQKARKKTMNYVVGPMISKRSVIGWTTNGHTGEDLFFYHFGLNKPLRIIENTDIAHLCSAHLGTDLKGADARLFLPADEAFGRLGATIHIDDIDPENKALIVQKGQKSARFPLSKDLMELNGKVKEMEGITVFAPKANNGQGRVYVPRQAVEWFGRH